MYFFKRYNYCFVIILVLMTRRILAYHFDVDNVILYEDPARYKSRGSYFGYSVALWNPGNNGHGNAPLIIIGAPRANSTAYFGANEPGTVFKCTIDKRCDEWLINFNDANKPTSHSLLGSTMYIENKTDPHVLVCGPNWTDKRFYNLYEDNAKVIPGMCYWAMANDFSKFAYSFGNLLPNPIPSSNNVRYGLQQAGFSVHVVPGLSTLEFILGSPGAYSWHGNQIRNRELQRDFTIPYPNYHSRDGLDYSGYAVTSGKYFSIYERLYATGVPRGSNLNGRVDLFEFPANRLGTINIRHSLYGKQIGDYFGSALATCDIDGDGMDDLLVGAPQWTRNLDEGRVYIYSGINPNSYHSFKKQNYIEGETRLGRFGSTITCLGDIDYDGYADVAVGAPYDGNGVVYIYHGSKNGLKRSQVINGPKETKAFGFAISEPRDIDNNGYADIAVGACLSGHVTLIRSKRVVSTKVKISSSLSEELLSRTAEYFSIEVCSSYEGAYPPENLNVIKTLKIDEINNRATVDTGERNSSTYEFLETLSLRSPKCREFQIYINKEVSFDYFKPLTLFVSQRLATENDTLSGIGENVDGKDNFHTSDAVTKISNFPSTEDVLSIPFGVECNRNICYSNMSIELSTDLLEGTSFVIGTPNLRLNVKVNNIGDNAYLAEAFIYFPIIIGISKLPSDCTKDTRTIDSSMTQIKCNIGNPLTKNETKTYSLELDMSSVLSGTMDIEFNGIAKTTSNNSPSRHYQDRISIVGVVEADIGIAGKTDVDWYSYMNTQKEEQLPNVIFKHTYEIKNYGITPLAEAVLSISIPTHWLQADNEIEIIKLNETIGELDGERLDCQISEGVSNTVSSRYDPTTVTEWIIGENSSNLIPQKIEKKFINIDGKVFSASPDNRTLYINTTNPLIKSKTIDCRIGPFGTAQSAAKVVLTLNLILSNLTVEIIEDKDIIFIATNGSTKITKPLNFIQSVNNQPDVMMIGTMFIGSSKMEHRVATWVIALSVLVGLLLLILVIIALFKFGFFKRDKKRELEALVKETEDMPPRVVLETGSSVEDSEHMN